MRGNLVVFIKCKRKNACVLGIFPGLDDECASRFVRSAEECLRVAADYDVKFGKFLGYQLVLVETAMRQKHKNVGNGAVFFYKAGYGVFV